MSETTDATNTEASFHPDALLKTEAQFVIREDDVTTVIQGDAEKARAVIRGEGGSTSNLFRGTSPL